MVVIGLVYLNGQYVFDYSTTLKGTMVLIVAIKEWSKQNNRTEVKEKSKRTHIRKETFCDEDEQVFIF